jgi:hypothetical protein
MPKFVYPWVVWLADTGFSKLMIGNKYWWAFLMDMHFIGLVMLVGAVGIFDLRILGVAKALPIAPLHRLVPWAIAGFAINLITGTLAFIGMPLTYTYDMAFWLKMSAILLAGLNVAAFYATGTFSRVEQTAAGEDAPALAKFIAASSLLLWFAVIVLGRYIAFFSDTISSGSN